MTPVRIILLSILGVLTLIVGWGGWYVIPEGHVGVEKLFGKAVMQTDPGIHMKIPIVVGVERIEVRQRKNVEQLAAATQNQLPVTADVSINWTVHKSAAMELFIDYGGLDQFENRVLDPKLRSSSKAAISRFPADVLIRDRNAAVAEIMIEMTKATEGLPITINSPQLENVTLPEKYLEAIMLKEQAREGAEREKHNLEKQRLESLQKVNTADAEKQALQLQADGRAYQILTEARAEADAIGLINEQLAKSPEYISLVRAKAWDGKLPVTLLGGDSEFIIPLAK